MGVSNNSKYYKSGSGNKNTFHTVGGPIDPLVYFKLFILLKIFTKSWMLFCSVLRLLSTLKVNFL